MACSRLFPALPASCFAFVTDLSARLMRSFRRFVCASVLERPVGVFPIDHLEQRRLLASISYGYGNLDVVGDFAAGNTISVYRAGTDIVAKVGAQTKNIPASWISRINITGGNWTDNVSIAGDIYAGSYIKTLGGNDYVVGGGGNDSIF